MLLEFTVGNYRSFKEEQTFSLYASSNEEHRNTVPVPNSKTGLRVVRSAVIYGANASGKSNLLLAMAAMRDIVVKSASRQQGSPIEEINPFRFEEATRNAPTLFEAIFIARGTRYQYGFEATKKEVIEEWLYVFPNEDVDGETIFTRKYSYTTEEEQAQGAIAGEFEAGERLSGSPQLIWEATRPNSLFLSTASQLNNKSLASVFSWISSSLDLTEPNKDHTIDLAKGNEKERIIDFLRKADFGIESLSIIKGYARNDDSFLPIHMLSDSVVFQHVAGDTTVGASLDLEEQSQGTQMYFGLLGSLLEVIENSNIAIIDELGINFHPMLVREIIKLFYELPVRARKAPQLIFNTHDVTLLEYDLFRADQVWIAEKRRKDSATKLIPLTEFEISEDENLMRLYVQGRLGGVPRPRLEELAHSFRNAQTPEA